jgi:hypothetical protein
MATPARPQRQSEFVHLLAYPNDRPRFEQAKKDMIGELGGRHPLQADVIHEMLKIWESLRPVRDLWSEDLGFKLPMSDMVKNLIEHWETT